MADQEDRTEAATPRRLQKARDEGNVPVSREVASFAGLACAALALLMLGPEAARSTALRMGQFLAQLHRWDVSDSAAGALRFAAGTALRAASPFVLAALAGGVAAVLLQSGFLLNGSALRPDLSRVNPLAGLRRLFGAENLVEFGKSCVKVAALGGVAWAVLKGAAAPLATAPFWTVGTLLDQTMRDVWHLLLAMLAVQAAIAGADLFWVRLRHGGKLRMSREDIKQETKEADGDPMVKGRLRQLRLQRARRRMMAAVPKATVVLTNPTHYAVALAYDRGKNAAPRVVAKGVDEMAARIREVARENKVPLIANPPLARALHRVELDAEIPAEHFQAVAEIIAYVWKLGQRSRRAVL